MAHTVGQIPEFWVDILQVPLEALAPQFPPQVQSALNAGGREDETQLCQRQVQAGRHMAHPAPMLGAHIALGGTGKMNQERLLELQTELWKQ